MKSFLYVWAQQNYVQTLADKLGLSSCLQKRIFGHYLDYLLPFLSMNHVYTTETLGKELKKEQRTLCKGFTNKKFKYIPVHWDKCQAKPGKLMFIANHTVVNWGPHSMWLLNCSDDINNTMYDYITQVTWKVTNTTMEHYHDRGLLG